MYIVYAYNNIETLICTVRMLLAYNIKATYGGSTIAHRCALQQLNAKHTPIYFVIVLEAVALFVL